jgi:D-lactate dehydrogenase (cytochrome)
MLFLRRRHRLHGMERPMTAPAREARSLRPSAAAAALAALGDMFGARFSAGRAVREQHCNTTTWLTGQPPDAVVFPRSTAEVQAVVRICASHGVPVIPFGAGTSLEGQVNAPYGGVCIDLRDMNRVLAVHPEDLDCVVEPGVTRKQLNEYLRDQGVFFPIDPGADASIGGMAATRAPAPMRCATAP